MTLGPSGPSGHERPANLTGLRTLNAGNRGLFTLDGTRTHLVGDRTVAVIDPGPDEERHIAAVANALAGAREVIVLLTHRHPDHAAGAERLAEALDAAVTGPGRSDRGRSDSGLSDPAPLEDGAKVLTDRGVLEAVWTPGHTTDHVCYWWSAERALFAGDLLLGEGDTTWVAEYPDCVADYLSSLDRVDALKPAIILPAHGPPLTNPSADVERFRKHRLRRIDQVRAALESMPVAEISELVDRVYGPIPAAMRSAAEASLAALVEHLRGDA